MDIAFWSPYVLAIVLGLVLIVFGVFNKKSGTRKKLFIFGVPLAIVGVAVFLAGSSLPASLGFMTTPLWGGLGDSATITYSVADANSQGVVIDTYQPTVSYATQDKFSTTSISGTSYYQDDGNPTTTTAITNIKPGVSYKYWVDNSTYWVALKDFVGQSGANSVVNKQVWANGSSTVTIYDLVNRQPTTSGVYNTSLGANKQANEEFTYQGTSKKSAVPFGGVLIVEYNATIADVSCTGDDLLASNPFHVTYTPSVVQNTYKVYGVGSTLDDGTGAVKKITCQFNNGGTAVGAGDPYYFKIIQANYYVSQTGEVLLDVEKFADQSTTRTGLKNTISATGYFGA